ncbi:MAG: AIM24 family protein, partial [Anaerolineae bacterium]
MKAHEVNHEIFGDDLQFVEVELDPGETVIAEAGTMMYMEDGIGFETKMGDGSKATASFLEKMVSVGKRALTGESLFMTHFTCTATEGKRHVAFGAPYPGKIIAIDLDSANGELICQKDSFLCAAMGTELSIAFNKKLGSGLFGGEGFILQRLRGDGMVFIHAGGTIVEKRLVNQKV